MAKWFVLYAILWPFLTQGQCGLCERSVDLVVNGNFSAGNSGFSSEMNYVTGIFTCPLCPENTYTIGANAVFYHSGFAGTDHTNPPSGSFFIANGMGALGSTVWCQTMPVQPQTDYTFSFWTRDVTNNSNPHPMAQLFASFNGVWSTDSIVAQGGWTQFSSVWNSGDATSLELCIINNQSQTGGNDFGLDDISFTACEDIHLQQAAFAGADAVICSNESLVLGQNPASGYQYTWTATEGLNASNIANPTLQISNTSGSDLTYELVVVRDSANVGCIASDTVMVTILDMPFYAPIADTVVCPGQSADLSVAGNWTEIVWDNSIVGPAADLAVGDHQVVLHFDQCSLTDAFVVLAEPMPNLDLPDVHEACAPEGVLLNLSEEVIWSDGTSNNFWLGFASDTVSWIYEQNNCYFFDTTHVIIYPEPTWTLGEGLDVCDDATVSIDPQWPGDWDVVGQQNILVTSIPGNYVFTANSGNCSYFFPFEVRMNYTPVLPDDEWLDYCPDRRLEIGVDPNSEWDFVWQNDSTGSKYIVEAAGTYWLYASNTCGMDSMRFEVNEIVCSSHLFIPSAFTPNEDFVNDAWMPKGHDISNYHLWIYDQLGQAIFETRDWTEGWSPGTGRADGAYAYRIEYQDYQGESHIVVGHINLLR